MKKIVWLLLLFLILTLFVVSIYMIKNESSNYTYEPDYYSKLGIRHNKNMYQYSTMINELGQPLKIEEKDGKTRCIYEGLYFTYEDRNINIHSPAFSVTVTSDKYKFGSEMIGIGSSKAEVEKAYHRASRREVSIDSIGYRDGRSGLYPWIIYYFDKYDKVSTIKISLSV
ncbi:hypothetical protein [Paenibacillus alvei]|uniref:hypothetical protein n=1 Tax=Paenibacillus alvei TaxID=44250 RepID=UPI0022811AC5|nr:hypothetical protein [Paenibacillus alvei]